MQHKTNKFTPTENIFFKKTVEDTFSLSLKTESSISLSSFPFLFRMVFLSLRMLFWIKIDSR